MASENPIFQQKSDIIESINLMFQRDLSVYQRQLFDKIIKLMDKLSRDATGRIIFNSQNIANITTTNTIYQSIKDELLSGKFLEAVTNYAQSFDDLKKLSDAYFKKELSDFKESKAADALYIASKRDAIEQLVGSKLEVNFLQPIKSTLQSALASNANWSDTVTLIRNFVEGDEEADGKLLKHAKQIGYDSIANADRGYSNVIAEELDSEFFVWAGAVLASTRCFCNERANSYYHHKEIEAWGRGDDLGKCDQGDGTWAGMREGTNEATIFQFAGGYNCGHIPSIVSAVNVPKDVIQRNIDNGNYEPSDKELEMLDL